MTAIDPSLLGEQIEHALSLVTTPRELEKALTEIFYFYADRTRRPSAVLQLADSIESFGTPGPVVRKVRRELVGEVKQRRIDPAELINILWSSDKRELQIVAVGLIKLLDWQYAVERGEQLIRQSNDPRIIDAFGQLGFERWAGVSDDAILELLARWLVTESVQLQQVSLLILSHHLENASSELLPRYFEILQGEAGRLDSVAQKPLRQVIRQLARWNPAETAQFLLDEARRNAWNKVYRRLIKDCLADFPQSQQLEIAAALKAQ